MSKIEINAKVDTSAMSNLIPWECFKQLKHVHFRDTPIRLFAFGGVPIDLGVRYGNKFTSANYHVVKSNGPALLGFQTSRKLGLVTLNFTIGTKIAEQDHTSSTKATQSKPEGDEKERERILKEFADMFNGIGCLPGEYSINIDPSVPPVIHPPRWVPIALKEKFKVELDSLVDQDIITPVTKPTSWVISFVCVTKRTDLSDNAWTQRI